jgi:hypothetical protein
MKEHKTFLVSLLLFCTILFFSCKKEDTGGNFAMQIFYEGTRSVNVDIYASRSDMYNNRNVIFSGRTNGVAKVVIPDSKLEKGKTYFIDAYTDNFSSHSLYSGIDSFVYAANTPFYPLGSDSATADPTFIRKVLSDSNQTITTQWTATDIVTTDSTLTNLPHSIWNTLTNVNNRYKKLTFNKDFSGSYKSKDSLGAISTVNFTYKINGTLIDIPNVNLGNFVLAGATDSTDVFYFPSVANGVNVNYIFTRD